MNTTVARLPNSKALTATGNPILSAIITDASDHADSLSSSPSPSATETPAGRI